MQNYFAQAFANEAVSRQCLCHPGPDPGGTRTSEALVERGLHQKYVSGSNRVQATGDTIDELYRSVYRCRSCSKQERFIACLFCFFFLMFIMELRWTCKSNTRCNVQYQPHKDIFLLHAYKKAYPYIFPLLG